MQAPRAKHATKKATGAAKSAGPAKAPKGTGKAATSRKTAAAVAAKAVRGAGMPLSFRGYMPWSGGSVA